MSGFDYATATPAETRAEAARRSALRAAGKPFTEPMVLSQPYHAIHVQSGRRGGKTAAMAFLQVVPGTERGLRRVHLPWSALVADNAKYAPAARSGKPVIILSTAYRSAKKKAVALLTAQLAGLPPLEGRLQLRALLFEPDRRTRRDISNYAKLVHDALTGLAYEDDSQLDRVEWVRAGVDIDAPRLELVIEAFT